MPAGTSLCIRDLKGLVETPKKDYVNFRFVFFVCLNALYEYVFITHIAIKINGYVLSHALLDNVV